MEGLVPEFSKLLQITYSQTIQVSKVKFLHLFTKLQFKYVVESRDRVLKGELYTQGIQLIYLYLSISTVLFRKDFSSIIRTNPGRTCHTCHSSEYNTFTDQN